MYARGRELMASRKRRKKAKGLYNQASRMLPSAIEKRACVIPHPGQGRWVISSKGQNRGNAAAAFCAGIVDKCRKMASARNPHNVKIDIFFGIKYFSIYLPKSLFTSSCCMASATIFRPKMASPTLSR